MKLRRVTRIAQSTGGRVTSSHFKKFLEHASQKKCLRSQVHSRWVCRSGYGNGSHWQDDFSKWLMQFRKFHTGQIISFPRFTQQSYLQKIPTAPSCTTYKNHVLGVFYANGIKYGAQIISVSIHRNVWANMHNHLLRKVMFQCPEWSYAL